MRLIYLRVSRMLDICTYGIHLVLFGGECRDKCADMQRLGMV